MKIKGKRIIRIFRNRYILSLSLFIIWIGIFDGNNLIERRRDLKIRNKLIKEKQYYKEQIQEDGKRLKELMSTEENLEKFAREQYLMKREDEDIFIIH
ncbi:MAG: septum formation inhibitor [Bacteroidales bacterium]|nr:septum formation inhibitor [Bacteroidales bacterium]